MRFDSDTLTEILDTLTRNKSRSFLTAFGVFWGIFMLVLLSGGGNGLKQMLWAQFAGFATNSGFSFSNTTSLAYKGFNKGRYWNLTAKDLENVRKTVSGIDVITGEVSEWNKSVIFKEKKYEGAVLKGLYSEYNSIEKQPLKFGRFINEIDCHESRKVAVLGFEVYKSLFPNGNDPCGEYVSVDGVHYRIIGVSTSESNVSVNGSTRESVMVPCPTLAKTYGSGDELDLFAYTAKPGCKVSDIAEEVASLLKASHLIHPDDKQAVASLDAEAEFSMVDNLFLGLEVLIWMVGLGTLFAGAIGVSNIMIVTIKERTSEIGIRRAIGAHTSDILMQIISECLVLTIIAGLFGLTVGVLALHLADSLILTEAGAPYGFGISLSVGVSITIILTILGVTAALAPALRAMAIKPIEAMREE